MKFAVVILFLGLYSTGLVTEARRDRPYGMSPEDEEASNRIVQCQTDVMSCAMPAMKYQAADPMQSVLKLKAAGAQQVCNEFKPIANCASKKLKQSACRDYPDQYKTMFTRGIRLVNLLCVDKFTGLKKHWDCLLSLQTANAMSQCDREAQGLMACNTAPLANCVANLFKNRPGCEAGADAFVREIFPDAISIATHCPDRSILAEYLLEFMKFK